MDIQAWKAQQDARVNAVQHVPTFKSADEAFDAAIASGRLSADPQAVNYAGLFMYMGTFGANDQFKNIRTRQYLPAVR